VKCSNMNLIINSGLGFVLKMISLKSEVWDFFDILIMASDSYHDSHPVSFLYILYKLKWILFIKTLDNPLNLACQSKYSEINILLDLIILPFYIITNNLN